MGVCAETVQAPNARRPPQRALPSTPAPLRALRPAAVGLAVSKDGISWVRGSGGVAGARGEARSGDVGRVLAPNKDSWWWHDTCHMHVADVQVGQGGAGGQ